MQNRQKGHADVYVERTLSDMGREKQWLSDMGGGEAMFWVLQGLQTFYYMNSYDLIHEGYTSLRSISILSLSSLL